MVQSLVHRNFLGAAVIAACCAALPAQSQQKQVMKAADVHPLGYPTVEAIVRMGKKLEKATNGRISIQMFPSMQLGGEKEMIEQAQVGALQIARISVGAMGPVVDELNVFNMPFIFRDEAHMRKVIDGPIGQELLDKITAARRRGWSRSAGWTPARATSTPRSRCTKPADLKGMKIRMMGNPIFVETMNAMGGNGVAMGFNELYSALQTGVVDGAENNPPTLLAQNHYQTLEARCYSLTGHLIIPEIFVFSKAHLGQAVQGRPGRCCRKLSREAQLEQRELWDAMVADADGQAEGRRRGVRPGRQGGVLQGDAADARQVRRQVRRADEAHRRHEVADRTVNPRPPEPRRLSLPWRSATRSSTVVRWSGCTSLHRALGRGAGRRSR